MADVTGAYTSSSCVVSQNTEAVLRHKARFEWGATYVALPLIKGTRYIIYSVISNGTYVKIGLSTNGTTISADHKTYFTFTKTAAPLDLSAFFSATPFTQYFEPNAQDVYLLVLSDAAVAIGVVEYKG